jgi:hypothetical protein
MPGQWIHVIIECFQEPVKRVGLRLAIEKVALGLIQVDHTAQRHG